LQGVLQRLAQKRKQEEEKRNQQAVNKQAKVVVKKPITKAKQKKTVAAVQRHYVPNKPFSTLRGKLSWPVRGKMTQKFGSTRNSKQRCKGVIISAAAGTRVHAIARGKVEFSGRLRGYGYLVIIRHDKNYRSLYAYNRAVYKKEGQIVKAGEVIAAVGSSGSQDNSGLYFEIRRGTAHQNPNRWVK
jgi:septal ring factor EnvC (AmiA/AmiB activator)